MSRTQRLKQKANMEPVRSEPTMCLDCHLIVTLTYLPDADPVSGAWECRCGAIYPLSRWKIRRALRSSTK